MERPSQLCPDCGHALVDHTPEGRCAAFDCGGQTCGFIVLAPRLSLASLSLLREIRASEKLHV